MIAPSAALKIFVFNKPTSMRNGPDGLAALVEKHFDESVFSGHLFVFISRRRDRLKLLCFEPGGFVVYYKRLEKGRFVRPLPDEHGRVCLSAAQLAALLEGIDIATIKRPSLWNPDISPRQSPALVAKPRRYERASEAPT